MPRKKSGTFDQSKYIQQFMKEKITVKKVSFNREKDADLLGWIEGRSFSTYVKDLIREDMEEFQNVGHHVIVKNTNGVNRFFCPTCNSEIISDGDPIYCDYCGQRLNWIDKYI